jgi:hypothetical protein
LLHISFAFFRVSYYNTLYHAKKQANNGETPKMKLTKSLEQKIKLALSEANNYRHHTLQEQAEIVHTVWSLNLLENKTKHRLCNRRFRDIPEDEKDQFMNMVIRLSNSDDEVSRKLSDNIEGKPTEESVAAPASPTNPVVPDTAPTVPAPVLSTPSAGTSAPATSQKNPQQIVTENIRRKPLGRSSTDIKIPNKFAKLRQLAKRVFLHTNEDSFKVKGRQGIDMDHLDPIHEVKDSHTVYRDKETGTIHIVKDRTKQKLNSKEILDALEKAQDHVYRKTLIDIADGRHGTKQLRRQVEKQLDRLNKLYANNLRHDDKSHKEVATKIGRAIKDAINSVGNVDESKVNKAIKRVIHEDYIDGMLMEHGLHKKGATISLPIGKKGEDRTTGNTRISVPVSLFKQVLLDGRSKDTVGGHHIKMQDKNKNQVDEILRRNRSVGVGERLKEAYDRSNKEFQDDSAATKQELIRYKDRAVKNISWLAGALQRKGSSLKQFFTEIMRHLGQKARKLNPRVPIDKAVRFMKKRNNPYIDSFNRNPPSQS